MDIVIEQEHPQVEKVSEIAGKSGATVVTFQSPAWRQAASSGESEWIVLVDRHSTFSPSDLQVLAHRLSDATAPVCLIAWGNRTSLESTAWTCLPPVLAAHWNNPTRYAAVCVQRSQLAKLLVSTDGQLDGPWQWLARMALQTGAVAWAKTDAAPNFVDLPDAETRLPALVPSPPASDVRWIVDHIARLKPSHLVPAKKSEADSVAVKAGLLQWHDALDASHQLSQSVEGLGENQAGDYWHAINHRREPDYGNSKYWFRQFGTHPIFGDLATVAGQILERVPEAGNWTSRLFAGDPWDPLAFVDLCEACAGREDSPLGKAARQIQATEMLLLMAATYRAASGK